MSVITFNFEKKHIFLIIGIIIYIIDEIFHLLCKKKKNYDIGINFLNYLSKIFLIIPYFFVIEFSSRKNNDMNYKNFNFTIDLNNIYNFKVLPNEKNFRNFIIKLLIFYCFSELYYNLILDYNPNHLIKIHNYKIALFILIIFFNKIIFKEKFFVHHYLTIFLIIIFLLILTFHNYIIWKNFNLKPMQLIYILNDSLALILMSFDVILFKYLIVNCYMNGYLIFSFLGIIQTLISLIIYKKKIFIIIENKIFILIFISFLIKHFYFIFFIQKFDVSLYGIIMFGASSFYYLLDFKNKDEKIKKNLKYFFKGSFIFSFFVLFIFSENIQFNFCGLNEHTITKKTIDSKNEEKEAEKTLENINDNDIGRKTSIKFFE